MIGVVADQQLNPDSALWICALALDQNADIGSQVTGPGVLDGPFAHALRSCDEMIVTYNAKQYIYSRAWVSSTFSASKC